MLTLRRPQHESRIEIMPLIDVVFLLLTFFIYAMVLMVRAEIVPMQLKEFESGSPAKIPPAVTVSIDHSGSLFINRESVEMDQIILRLMEFKKDDPSTVIYLAAEEYGTTDRLPTFLELYDKLSLAGLDIKLVGKPSP
ncbi:MAG: biopolymer transporter ExbD [Planctomycetes bacterium]|nr:biopolymer transporter ExbD [Planctomycetota bacterium]